MSIYTKQGDTGFTSLLNGEKVSKADDRIELIGMVDELSSLIGLVKPVSDDKMKKELSIIQEDLMIIMAALADLSNDNYKINLGKISEMEEKIDLIEKSFQREKGFVLYGGCESSARLDVARAYARKSERYMVKVNLTYIINENIMKYMNRLSDYLYMLARYQDNKF